MKICVYCGSSPGRVPGYLEESCALVREMAARNIGLVYGGASVGIMGAIADTVLQEGGQVIGVIPQNLVDREVAHHGLTELKIVDSMHERKAHMADLSDAFIALPGGIGTLEEIIEVLTWAQLGLHTKPCGLFNIGGYYDGLTAFLDHAVCEQFIKKEHRSMLVTDDNPHCFLDRLLSYVPPANSGKWLTERPATENRVRGFEGSHFTM